MTDAITLATDGPIATVVLDNPDKMNALTLEAWAGIGETMTGLSNNTDLRCVVIRGAGNRAFSAGADISEFPDIRADAAQAREYGKVVADALSAIAGCLHPTVAAIEGVCTGGGMEVACGCDIRIANASSRFGVPISKLGHAFAFAEMETMLTAVSRDVVLELILEARIIGSAEAERRGLVNRVVADEDFEDEIKAATLRIASGAPLVNRMTKKFLNRLDDPRPLSGEEIASGYDLCDSNDYAEGVKAFLAKKKPSFEGN